MKQPLLMFLALTMSLISFAQENNYSNKYGKITQYEASMTECPGDSLAEAIVVYSIGENYFRGVDDKGFILYMEIRKKIKILKPAGIEYANIEIPYYTGNSRENERVYDIEATTYNLENGELKKTELNKKQIFDEKVSDYYNIKKIALPDVREGSIIEYRYKIETPRFFNMREWVFQEKIPVIESKLEYRAIPYYEYTYIKKGSRMIDTKIDTPITEHYFGNLNYKEKVYTFSMNSIPAFRDEEYISTPKDYLETINFQLSTIHFPSSTRRNFMSTWPVVCNELLKHKNFGKYIKDAEKESKKILPTLDLDNKSDLEKAEIITQYVKEMYTWNEYYGEYSTDNLSSFLKLKKGNSGDLNLFLLGLLNGAGVEAYPIVLSTRKNGAITKTFPFQQFINYVVIETIIDGESHFIDATDPLRYFDELPSRCTNVEGLIVKKDSQDWTFLTQKEVSSTIKDFKIKVFPETNQLDVNVTYTSTGQDAYIYRDLYNENSENIVEYFRKKYNVNSMDSLITQNYKETNKPFILSFKSKTGLENTSEKLFIHPFCNLSISQNPFKQDYRILPIDLIYLESTAYKSVIEIPEGYEVEYLPKDINSDNRLMTIKYSTKTEDNQIIIDSFFEFKTNIYDAKDYIRLKATFSIIMKQFNDMVVLKKK